MLRRDFIMVQIEELGKVIAQIISGRKSGATRRIPEMIQVVYDSLRITPAQLLSIQPEAIRHLLDGEDKCGLQRMELAAKLLIEDAYQQPENRRDYLLKAKELIEYIQMNDNTFSLERISLLDEINSSLS